MRAGFAIYTDEDSICVIRENSFVLSTPLRSQGCCVCRKLRRGDPHTTFLHKEEALHIYKSPKGPRKSKCFSARTFLASHPIEKDQNSQKDSKEHLLVSQYGTMCRVLAIVSQEMTHCYCAMTMKREI